MKFTVLCFWMFEVVKLFWINLQFQKHFVERERGSRFYLLFLLSFFLVIVLAPLSSMVQTQNSSLFKSMFQTQNLLLIDEAISSKKICTRSSATNIVLSKGSLWIQRCIACLTKARWHFRCCFSQSPPSFFSLFPLVSVLSWNFLSSGLEIDCDKGFIPWLWNWTWIVEICCIFRGLDG